MSVLALSDLTVAFDTVGHKLVLDTLERCCGFRDMALKLLNLYLAEQMHTFQLGRDKSETFTVNCSVPQGSVLGPL